MYTATVDNGGPYPYGIGMKMSLQMFVIITNPSWLNCLNNKSEGEFKPNRYKGLVFFLHYSSPCIDNKM